MEFSIRVKRIRVGCSTCLSFVVEYSPLDVLECYLRPDAGPLLSQWVDLEWTPEEDE